MKYVDVMELVSLFELCKSNRYVLRRAQCPTQPYGGVRVLRTGPDTTNCVTFTAWILSHALKPSAFTLAQWKRWMVSGTAPKVLPVPHYGPGVVVEWGCGTTEPGDGPWLAQVFNRRGGGHSFIILDHERVTGRVLTLESCGSLDGIGYRQIGALRDVDHPGADWASKVTQTWAERIDDVKSAHVARLNITGVRRWLRGVS